MLKVDLDHPKFKGKVLCSAGIGNGYEKSINAKNNKFKGADTNETYRLPNGAKTKSSLRTSKKPSNKKRHRRNRT